MDWLRSGKLLAVFIDGREHTEREHIATGRGDFKEEPESQEENKEAQCICRRK